MPTDPRAARIFALVLAAGAAQRYGATKQTIEIDGVPLVRLAVSAATGVCGERTILVTGHDWRAVSGACTPLAGFLLRNDDFAAGLGASIALGVRCVRHAADAVLVVLADQPRVTGAHLHDLIHAWSGADDEIVATAFAGTAGPPVLFPRAAFDRLASLTGDVGARQLLADPRYTVRTVSFEPAALDVDTPADLERLLSDK
ncbi:MAG: nucleotidyltransferase family protein [Woeseiaceae bacterium]